MYIPSEHLEFGNNYAFQNALYEFQNDTFSRIIYYFQQKNMGQTREGSFKCLLSQSQGSSLIIARGEQCNFNENVGFVCFSLSRRGGE